MKKYPNALTILFYFFCLLFLGSLLNNPLKVIILRYYNPTMETAALGVLVTTLLQFIIYLILVVGIAILMRQFFKDEFKVFKNGFLKYTGASIIGWIFMYFLLIIYGIVIFVLKYEAATPENQELIQDSFVKYPLLMLPVLTLAAPFVEETIFRGIIFRTINQHKTKLTTIVAFIVSSCLFGFIHVFSAYLMSNDIRDIIDGIPYFISGFSLTLIYYKTKNIYVPMITHLLYNTAASFLMYISEFIQNFPIEDLTSSTIYILQNLLHLQ